MLDWAETLRCRGDLDKAKNLVEGLADQEIVKAQVIVGSVYMEQGNIVKPTAYLQKAEANSDKEAPRLLRTYT